MTKTGRIAKDAMRPKLITFGGAVNARQRVDVGIVPYDKIRQQEGAAPYREKVLQSQRAANRRPYKKNGGFCTVTQLPLGGSFFCCNTSFAVPVRKR